MYLKKYVSTLYQLVTYSKSVPHNFVFLKVQEVFESCQGT